MTDKHQMRAITLIQPFAELIVHGPKRVENRTRRPTPLKVGDYLAIHAGGFSMSKVAECWDIAAELAMEKGLLTELPLLVAWMKLSQHLTSVRVWPKALKHHLETVVPYGAIVGVARLAGVETEAPAGDPWWFGPIGWRLDEVVAIEPVTCSGALGLWEPSPAVLSEVRERYRAAKGAP